MYTNVDVYNQILISEGVPHPCQNGRENYGHQRSPMGSPNCLRLGHAQLGPLRETNLQARDHSDLADPLHCRT